MGGTLSGGRRKAVNITGRDLATLDLDNVPAGQTDDILRRVDGLGCAAAVYSTRKHCGYTPRLRVVIPFDRTALPDEYEPAARKLAALIGIRFCDPTTFDIGRLMYWPGCCRDSQYVYRAYDKPFCSLDGLLAAVEATPNILPDPAPAAVVTNYGASAIEYHLRCWSKVDTYWDARNTLMEEIKASFDRRGVTMTYNHLNVHIMENETNGLL